MARKVYVAGVGMIPFTKPGKSDNYDVMGGTVARAALADAGVATGLAQCVELVWQLRGQAGDRQVEGARVGLQHNLGLGGACVVSIYTKVG